MANVLRYTLWSLAIVSFSCSSVASEIDVIKSDIPVVLTPTRLRQSLADVPASVTVITADMIKRFGITSVPDALRLVPGMAGQAVTGNDFRVNYHGTNNFVPRRMNVLIDGVSVYRPALAQVDWTGLPVAIEDIDRIEVTRGSNSVSYGANSMLAIVNIITRHPQEVDGVSVSATAGSLNTRNSMVRYGGKIGTSSTYRITASRDVNEGYDYASSFGQGHDTTRLNRLNFRSVTDLAAGESFDWHMALVEGVKDVEAVDVFQTSYPDMQMRDFYLNGIWKKSFSPHHELKIQAYLSKHRTAQGWNTCIPTAALLPQLFPLWRSNPDYVVALLSGRLPSGGSPQDDALASAAVTAIRNLGTRAVAPTCVHANQDYTESREDIEVQDTRILSEKLRMVAGFGVRQDRGSSHTYLGGSVSNTTYRLFSNLEYAPLHTLHINAGGFMEKDQLTGFAFSPRLAINTHLNVNHTLRFVVSRGLRVPDILEQRANWTYMVTDVAPPLDGGTQGRFFQSATSPGNLRSEHILSREIGYFGNLPQWGILIDVKFFDDSLTDLISEKLQASNFSPTNTGSVRLRGSELQISYEPSDGWRGYLTYSYLHNDRATTPNEQTQYARHSGVVGLSRVLDNGWHLSVMYYGATANRVGQSRYGKEDLTVSKTIRMGRESRLTSSLLIRHLENRSVETFRAVGRSEESRFSRSMQYYVTFKLTY